MIVTPWHGTNMLSYLTSHVFNFFKKTPKHQTKPQTKQPTKQTSGTKSCSSSTLFPAFFCHDCCSLCTASVYHSHPFTAWEAAGPKALSAGVSLLRCPVICSSCSVIQLMLLLHPLISHFCPSPFSSGLPRVTVLELDWQSKKYSLNPRQVF